MHMTCEQNLLGIIRELAKVKAKQTEWQALIPLHKWNLLGSSYFKNLYHHNYLVIPISVVDEVGNLYID